MPYIFRKIMDKGADIWLSLSIRKKMFFAVEVIVTFVAVITIFSITMLNNYLSDFNSIMSDNYQVNKVLSDFIKEKQVFTEYVNEPNENTLMKFKRCQWQLEDDLKMIKSDIKDIGVQRYIITEAIRTYYPNYQDECDRITELVEIGYPSATQYYYCLHMSDYLKGYIEELLQLTINQGNDKYYKSLQTYDKYPGIALILGFAITAAAVFLCIITVRHTITRILNLADVLQEIAEDNLDVKDIEVDNKDEIGHFIRIFNKTKHSMTDSIAALKHENEIEKLLHREEVNRINAEKMLEKMQMSLLQSQINPHFLFNTLNTVSRMAKIENAVKSEDLIIRLSNLFRYNLQDANESVTLTKELNTINDYIFIQQTRFGDRLKYILDCCVNTDNLFVPTFTLQPIIENAIIHGISIKEAGGTIRLRIKQSGEFALITVTDNGVGISPEKLDMLMNQIKYTGHLSSLGINNVRLRINLLYANSYFKIFSREKLGTVIKIKIPLQV